MSDEVSVAIGDVVVTGNRSTGIWTVSVPTLKFSVTYNLVQRQKLDENGQPTGDPLPSDIAFQVEILEVMAKFTNLVLSIPGIPASDKARISALSDQLANASTALQMGEHLTDVRALVSDAFEVFYGGVGDFAGSVVTAALMGAAGLTVTSLAGPTGIVGGGLAILAGYVASEIFPAEFLADVTTDIVFLGYLAVHAAEQQMNESLSDAVRDGVRSALSVVYGNLPEGAAPQFSISAAKFEQDASGQRLIGSWTYDLASFENSTAGISVNLSIDAPQNIGGSLGTVRLFTIEAINGTAYADVLIGNFANNNFRGGIGDDYIDGGAGFDYADYRDAAAGVAIDLRVAGQAHGDRGADTLISIEGVFGSDFNDVLTGNDESNTLVGGWGDDVIHGMGGDDVIIAHGFQSGVMFEVNHVDGGEGSDTISFARDTLGRQKFGAKWTVEVDLEAGYARIQQPGKVTTYLTSIENVIGHDGNDTIRGDANRNELLGGGGNDRIWGGAGDDFIDGGAGNDTLDGGDGNDTLSLLSASKDTVAVLGSGMINGDVVTGFENLMGSLYNDHLTGDAGGNSLWGADGADQLFGLAGDDFVDGGLGDDILDGGEGDDILVGGGGTDRIEGGGGFDLLRLQGVAQDYTVTMEGDGIRIIDTVAGRDGSILITGIEALLFGDGASTSLASEGSRSSSLGDLTEILYADLYNPTIGPSGSTDTHQDWMH